MAGVGTLAAVLFYANGAALHMLKSTALDVTENEKVKLDLLNWWLPCVGILESWHATAVE